MVESEPSKSRIHIGKAKLGGKYWTMLNPPIVDYISFHFIPSAVVCGTVEADLPPAVFFIFVPVVSSKLAQMPASVRRAMFFFLFLFMYVYIY